MIKHLHALLIAGALALAVRVTANSPVTPAPDIAPFEKGGGGGLALVVGIPDGGPAGALARSGRWLAHVLDTDRKAITSLRDRFAEEGLLGLATAELRADLKTLPLRDGMVNLVLVDAARKDTPAREELLRVLAAGGTLWTQEGKDWRQVAKKEGALGSWSHDYGGPDLNPVSRDTKAGLPMGLQWMAGYGVGTGDPLIAEGVSVTVEGDLPKRHKREVVPLWNPLPPEAGGPKRRPVKDQWGRVPTLAVRDAASGVLLWETSLHTQALLGGAFYLIHQGRVFWFLVGEPMRSADLRTGERELVYDKGVTWTLTTKKINNPDIPVCFFAVDGNLVQAQGNRVVCLDAATGDLRWEWKTEEPFVNALSGGHDGQVYVGTGNNPLMRLRYFGSREAKDLVALGLKDGKVRWKAPVPEGELGQVMAFPGGVAIVASAHHGWNTSVGYVAAFDGKDGKKRWQKGWGDTDGPVFTKNGKPFDDGLGNNAIIWGNSILLSSSFGMRRWSLVDGTVEAYFGAGNNQGCQRVNAFQDGELVLATVPTLLRGMWGDPTKATWEQNTVSHLNCAQGFVPAAGRLYSRSIVMCGCGLFLRNNQCYAMDVAASPVADAERLSTVAPAQPTQFATNLLALASAGDWHNRSAYSPLGSVSPHAAVPFRIEADGLTPGVTNAGLVVRCRTHAQYVEATDTEGKLLWRFQADARVIAEPLIHEGRVYVGGRDGWLYCLDAKTGQMQWRFLAAAADRRFVNSGQLESVWPCLGAVAHEGLIWTAAGVAADLDGGVFVWGLNKEGAIQRRAVVRQKELAGGAIVGKDGRSVGLKVPYHHIYGGGFAAQKMAIHEGALMLGYRRSKNFGSHPPEAWVYLPINPQEDGVVVPGYRPDVDPKTVYRAVLDEPPAPAPKK